MKNLLMLLFAFVLIVPLPFSCDYTGGGGYGPSEFQIDSLALKAGRIITDGHYHGFSEINFDSVSTDDTLSASFFGLELSITDVSYISKAVVGSVYSSAYADPVPATSTSKLSLISIYSSSEVSANGMTYAVGSNLIDLFEASRDYDEPTSILKFIENKDEWYDWQPILLHFHAQLDKSLDQTFEMKVTMDDGAIFNLTSSRVLVK